MVILPEVSCTIEVLNFQVNVSNFTMFGEDQIDFSSMTRNEIIYHYKSEGHTHKEIVSLLLSVHDIVISQRQVRRILRNVEMHRKKPTRDIFLQAINFVERDMQDSGQVVGYRTMWKRLQQTGICIPQRKALVILRHLDPEGVNLRRRRRLQRRAYRNPGPNFAWHIDGYDKLKRYGFPIHGGIDGFSRKILWLNVGSTNNNPILIAKYFVKTCIDLDTLPCVVRADRGNENVHVKRIQTYFRSMQDDILSGEDSFQYGKSTGNQRIEAFWGQLRKQCGQFWMDLFQNLVHVGMLDLSSRIEAMTLKFCFLHLLRNDLNRMAREWNTHRIRQNRSAETVGGKPNVLYFSPESIGATQCRKAFPQGQMNVVFDTLDNMQDFDDHEPDFIRLLTHIKDNVQVPLDIHEAKLLYFELVQALRQARNQ